MPFGRFNTTIKLTLGVLLTISVVGTLFWLPPHKLSDYRTNRKVEDVPKQQEDPVFIVFFDPNDSSFESLSSILRVAYHSLYLQPDIQFLGVAVDSHPEHGLQPLHEETPFGPWELPFPVLSDKGGALQRYYGVYPHRDVWVVVVATRRVLFRACLDVDNAIDMIGLAILSAHLALVEGDGVAHVH